MMAISAWCSCQPRSSRSARAISRPRTAYSVKWPSFRRKAWRTWSVCRSALGKIQARTGRITDSVRGPANPPLDATKMTAAHAPTGPQRARAPRSADKLGDRLRHEGERLLVEFGVDEALDLLPLRGVALAGRPVRELRPREDVQILQHGGTFPGIAGRELLIERQAHRQEREPVLQVFVEVHQGLLGAVPPRSCSRMSA